MSEDKPAPASGRLFVGIKPPDYVTEAVNRVREEESGAMGISWGAPEKLHLTLAFLGEVDSTLQPEIFRRLPEANVRPFYLALEGLGVFPRKGRPQVLWAGLAPADPLLFQLHGKVERILLDLGFEPERRRFSPHLTLARCGAGSGPAVAGILKKHREFGPAPFQVNECILFASELTSRGSIYTELMRIPSL